MRGGGKLVGRWMPCDAAETYFGCHSFGLVGELEASHRPDASRKADGSAPASERANDATFFFPTVETHFSDIAHPRTPHSYALRPQSHTLETRGSSQVSGHTRSTTSSVKQRWPSNFRGLRNSRPSARQATLPDEINTLPRPVPVRCTHPESASSCAELWT